MNIGEKIVKARKEKGMTQAELGSELHVTFQAVSKWERGESSPDFETICNMAKILEVPVSYFENSDEKEDEAKDEIKEENKEENKEEKETKEEVATTVVYEQPKPVLAVCEKCNRPIYNGSEIIRYDVGRVICRECRDREKKRRFQEAVEKGKKNRIKSFVISGILFVVFLMLAIANGGKDIGYGIASAVMIFTFSSCLILNNNCIADVFGSTATTTISARRALTATDGRISGTICSGTSARRSSPSSPDASRRAAGTSTAAGG